MRTNDFLDDINTDEDRILFSRCIRSLLHSTFIVEDRESDLFHFLVEHRSDISEYLQLMGYDIECSEEMKYAELVQSSFALETPGLKRLNLVMFSNNEVLVLLSLWYLYQERVSDKSETYVTYEDITDKQKLFGISVTPSELRRALERFKRFRLINYSQSDLEENNGAAVIRLYPTLMYSMDHKQLSVVINDVKNAMMGETSHKTDEEGETDADE